MDMGKPLVVVMGLIGISVVSSVFIVQNKKQAAAHANILSDKNLTAEQYANFSKRVAKGETTWQNINDSIEATKPAKIEKVKAEIIKDTTVTPQKFYNFEKRAGKDLNKWSEINDSLKALQMVNLSKKTADTIKTVISHR